MTATRGPQVVLEGYARDVARGGGGKTMRDNMQAMDQLISAGLVADGNAVDGTSRTGAQAYDPVVAQFPHAPVSTWEVPAPLLNVSTASGGNLPLGGGTLTGDLVMTTGTRFALDTAAYGGVPNMYMYSLGGAVVFYADGWNEWTPSAFRGINFKVFGNGGADEYWGVTGGPNGTGSTLKAYSVSGGWPCIGSILASNEGQLMLGNDTGTILNIQGPTGQLTKNYIQLVGGGPGVPATFNVVGESPGHMELVANGSGNVYIGNDNWTGTAGKATVEIGGLTAAEVNGIRIAGNSAGNAPVITSSGDDTNISLVVGPKGTGSLQAASSGNARGTYSTDWQHVRSTNAQVASGNNAVISGGNSNTASADYALVGGGFQNTADGTYATIPGGIRAWARGQHGWLGFSSGVVQGVTDGDAQLSWRMLMGVSTGGAAVRLTSDRGAINTTVPNINSVLIGSSLTVGMTIMIVGCDKTATSSRMNCYFNDVLIAKTATGGTTIYLGTPRTLGVDLPTIAITIGAEATPNLSVVVTPFNANTWHFVAKLSATEVN